MDVKSAPKWRVLLVVWACVLTVLLVFMIAESLHFQAVKARQRSVTLSCNGYMARALNFSECREQISLPSGQVLNVSGTYDIVVMG